MRTRELERAVEAIDLLEPHEPDSTMLLAPLLELGLCRRVGCWVAEGDDGRPAAVVVIVCHGVDRWVAHPFLFDPPIAARLAAMIDRSRAVTVSGPAHHVEPLVPHLRKVSGRIVGEFLRLPQGAFLPARADDSRIRIADLSDLKGLLDLYQNYELEPLPACEQLDLLREAVCRRLVLVAGVGGRLVGAFRLVGWTRLWAVWDELTVLPEERLQGLAWGLVHRSARETAVRDRRWMTVKNVGNPMAFPKQLGAQSGDWVAVGLHS